MDRPLINADWGKIGNWKLQALPRKNLDHRPILLFQHNVDWGPKPFRVFNIWLKEESLIKKLREEAFNNNSSSANIQTLLRRCKEVIEKWNKGSNGNIFRRIKEVVTKLVELEENCKDMNELVVTKMILEELNLKKDQMLKKQARVLWLKEVTGTNFFTKLSKK